jgi:hypothetical protein
VYLAEGALLDQATEALDRACRDDNSFCEWALSDEIIAQHPQLTALAAERLADMEQAVESEHGAAVSRLAEAPERLNCVLTKLTHFDADGTKAALLGKIDDLEVELSKLQPSGRLTLRAALGVREITPRVDEFCKQVFLYEVKPSSSADAMMPLTKRSKLHA